MRSYLYVIVRSDGNALPLNDVYKGKDISTLLQQGWQPLHETRWADRGRTTPGRC